jgi:hypothetical protein
MRSFAALLEHVMKCAKRIRLAAASFILLACGSIHAAGVDADYQFLSGTNWQVALTLRADGTPPAISEFSVYFPETSFSAITLLSSPAGWDSLIIAPDLALPAAGFLDALLPSSVPGLSAGQQQGGWLVNFSFSGVGAPGPLTFDIVDANFNAVASGMTTVVPEPSVVSLLLAGLLTVAVHGRRSQRASAGRVGSDQ